MAENDINALLESNIKPMSLLYNVLRDTVTQKPIALYSVLKINSMNVGTLMPEQYANIASRSNYCVRLADWNIRQVCMNITQLMRGDCKFRWISACVPTRMLQKGGVMKTLTEIKESGFTDFSKLCLVFPLEILYEDKKEAVEWLQEIKDLGILTAIEGFGSELCPTMRLAGLPLDCVFLDETLNSHIRERDEKYTLEAVTELLKSQRRQIIATQLQSDDQRRHFKQLGAFAYGNVSGALGRRYRTFPQAMRDFGVIESCVL